MAGNKKRKQSKTSETPKTEEVVGVERRKTKKKPVTKNFVSESESIHKLLEPYTKDQLIEFLCDAALNDVSLVEKIRSIADQDVSHRKIFVHGLAWDTTKEALNTAFESYGDIEDCNLVVDKVTGKAKGYGFILFKSRTGAENALKEPQKNINNRVTHSQLASSGPAHAQQQFHDRKIYVSNVQADVDPDKLRSFFSKFGEIESGPLGFDNLTGKSKGYALFVYKNFEGAKKAIEEPNKIFEGHQLHCQKASDSNKNKHLSSATATVPPALYQQGLQPPILAAVAAQQNLALFSQHPSLNPVYGASFMMNPLLMGSTPTTLPSTSNSGLGILGGSPSIYGSSLQGMQSYQTSHLGQSSSSRNSAAGAGYPSYM